MHILKHLYLAPIWLLELLSSAKSFQSNPILGNALLNRLGLHVCRLLLSHTIMRLRMHSLTWGLSKADRQAYFRDGYLLKENYLSSSKHRCLKEELSLFSGETRQSIQGNAIVERTALAPHTLSEAPALRSLLSAANFKRLCRFTSGHVRPPLFYLETIQNDAYEQGVDPQKSFHSDTFHPTMKCWYFPNQVTPKHGAFTYIPGSHRLTWKRLKWEYQQSINATSLKNALSQRGSFRFSDEDIQVLGLTNPISFTVHPNSLLFANTFGIHRRGDSEGSTTRTSIWGDSRTNPFIPFPGLTNNWINEFQYTLLNTYRKNVDRQAAKAGRPSPWKRVPKKDHST
ncbi:MAG: Phytanoyl-CoA dioxygenase [uncultured Thiotrichaceae bacterium]|uniref:Phytanoyl-CoA dioxygenase n=1 Tax=uncultured Thiotrichaceae bacterium TaxID=298394 RepID=A0A6S6SCQ2_9GAMM|nr:MAG: Phytanoyl-CoA dioxygenase [uncultured Thiotrichaceae bacterium]